MKLARHSSCARWTAAELDTLTTYWARGATRETLMRQLPGRSWDAISQRAELLELPRIPEGWCTVSEAARRAGYCYEEFVRLLAEWKARTRPHPRPGHSRMCVAAWRWRIVCWRQLASRVNAHEGRRLAALGETSSQAAARLGVPKPTLYGWACADGIYQSEGKGRTVRLPRETWGQVVSRHRAETPVEAGRRLNVHATTLRGWMRAANASEHRPGRVQRHAPEVYDRLLATMRQRVGKLARAARRAA